MIFTKAQFTAALDNISGPLPSELFEELLDSLESSFAELDTKVFNTRVTTSSALDTYVVFPVAGTVTRITSVINGAITVGDEVITFKKGSDSMGAITIANVGSAAGVIDSLVPSTFNTFSAGEAMVVSTNGGGTGGKLVDITIEYQLS